MHNNFKKYFENQEKLKKVITRNYDLAQQSYKNMNLTNLQDFYRHTDLITNNIILNGAISTEISHYNTVNPIVDALNKQLDFVNQINFANYDFIKDWHSSISHFVNSPSFDLTDSIPESLYDVLGDITSELDNSPEFHESDNDVLSEITVRNKLEPQAKEMNWSQLFGHILAIIMMIQTAYYNHTSSLQFEEEMKEMETQTQLLEKQIEIQEQILIDSHSKAEEELEIYEGVEEKLDLLIKSIESYMADSINQDEDSLE